MVLHICISIFNMKLVYKHVQRRKEQKRDAQGNAAEQE